MSLDHLLAPRGATAALAGFAANLTYQDLPDAVINHLKYATLDGLGCIIHGATLPWTQKIAEMAQIEAGKPEATIFGINLKVPAAVAALVNGTAGHAFELDDIHRDSIIHPNSLALPVAFSLIERENGLNGKSFLTAVAAGYEVGARIGSAAGPSLLINGFHPQGTTGVFTAAATAARLLSLGPITTQHALGIAGSLGAGLMAAQEGAMVKRLHSGRAAETGLRAALLAASGFTGITDVVEAKYGGFLSTHSTTPKPQRLISGLGREWELLSTGFKPYATVTSIHCCLDALSLIRTENKLSSNDIQSIDVAVSTPTYLHCAWPYKAQSVTAAQMNLFFGLAVMALEGEAFISQFTQAMIEDPRVLEMASRICAHIDPEIDAKGPKHRHAAKVTVTCQDGRKFNKQISASKGSPGNPFTPDQIKSKFRAITKGILTSNAQNNCLRWIEKMENKADVRELISISINNI
ncbi:MAG: hypothetical protein CBB68_02430 [Rhodospirillaceae bacterium TMED8]|nr:hypothetical protein [Magnetovibrio sp.]OUT52232.1 MAG: hypothetical protein CBB68_02430 [Rhodospirillaceae bacterium TMED8]|tara:strand:- start:5227 stop:6624 length:1398 start_codon:yes stop_codon:yes gene_type:complete